jgi:hypothetical protein
MRLRATRVGPPDRHAFGEWQDMFIIVWVLKLGSAQNKQGQ